MHDPLPVFARRMGALVAPFLVASLALAHEEAAPVPAAPAAAQPAGPDEAASYNLGMMLGEQLRNAGVSGNLSMDALMRGIREAVNGKAISAADKQSALQFMQAGREVVADRNRAEARAYLARNAKEAGITATASGLQYKVIVAGDPKGAPPGPNDMVTVQYRGRMLDGTEFDSSYARGGPASFPLSQTIKGWREALLLMKPGAKWQLYIPPELAYDAFSPPPIPPGSLLMFEVELLKVTQPLQGPPPDGKGVVVPGARVPAPPQ